ncbi:hypothetical protein [Inconstantimicrobium mannanitabidum]|uniref:Uncharacterized protein n=1 Tax=Inconstantimicrobium mannanitabidum TaxID=1604901 RepID=A0ACB5R9Z0_9CLOT|nr:hypothetical protein [Clostridium sp. TW13]GKX65818.1 hypothetical protein rsdtw13_10760 [Clostridium sp. TW13]
MRKKKYVSNDVIMDKQLVYALWIGDYVYTGSGKGERVQGNINKAKRGEHDNKLFQQAYNESDDKQIRPELLAYNLESEVEAREIEQEYINHFEKVEGVIVCNVRGADNGCTSEAYNKYPKLTEDKVREIKQLLDTCSNKELAETYNCSYNAISKIRNGIRWKNVIVKDSER